MAFWTTNRKLSAAFATLGGGQWLFFLWGMGPWRMLRFGLEALPSVVFAVSTVSFAAAFLHLLEDVRWRFRVPLSLILAPALAFLFNVLFLILHIMVH
ncbi:MAG: hypothetical protein MUC63_07375, partial [Planctomycetes bacterium]|nr:hypothetical protein [Planctomycetota bacterium]